jgi:peroxiredoxin
MHAALALLLLAGAPAEAPVIDSFALPDAAGAVRRLDEWRDRRLVVVVFLSADCPLTKLYAPRLPELEREFGPRGVAFVGVFPNGHDSPAVIARFGREHAIGFPLLRDQAARVADRFGATRTPEAFVLDRARAVRYRGRIDDQYDTAAHRAKPGRRDLAEALDELLTDRPVSVPATDAPGCLIARVAREPAGRDVTYCRDVAPLLQKRCAACHRAGQVAPFALTTYRSAAGRAETIREVLEAGRMPPWHADPRYGRFANDARMPDDEKQVIYDWIAAACPEGDPADLPPPRAFPDGWTIPGPDLVVSPPQPFVVPAQGTIEYQFIEVDPGFREDKWVRAAEVRPGNRKVVHHCTVFLKPPGSPEPVAQGALGSYCFLPWAPGTGPMVLPEGMAKLVPAGWHFLFVMHYTPVGSEQTDQTSLALTFADPKAVRKEVATKIMQDLDLCIPPRAADHRVEQTWRINEPVLLLALFPHMHLRGKSFRYDVTYPDGSNEVLLDVPRYDFNWQRRYDLAEPKRLPPGSLLRCTAAYDNSADNPANPDPDATVRAGLQSWDEMFNGYFDVALADEDRTAVWPKVRQAACEVCTPGRTALMVAVLGGWLALRRRFRNAPVQLPAEGQ